MRLDDCITLQYVHPKLSACVLIAYRRYETLRPDRTFRVTSGFRTEAEQARLLRAGKAQTMNSLHRYGLAVDLAILTRDRQSAIWDFEAYRYLNGIMQGAAQTLGITIQWGGEWIKLRDGVHWQLDHEEQSLPAFLA